MTGIKIIATGASAPKKVVTNDDLAKIVETSDEWISQRTGMKERHYVADGENHTKLAENAAMQAIEKAGIDKSEIGAVIVCTVSADYFSPSCACLIQGRLGLSKDIIAFDLSAGCSGFVFGLETIRALMIARNIQYGLVVGAEVLSKKMDMTDRGTCVLFGDGAAAAVVSLSDTNYTSVIGVDGDEEMINIKSPDGFIHMDGQGTYKFAVATVPKVIEEVVNKAGLTYDEIDHYVLHQANLRIIESIAKKVKQPMDKFVVNIDKYGNTSAASVGLALDEALEDGRIRPGEKVLLCAFGAGRTWGAVVLEM
ncbi:3-oxoacyl-[acyl-carrier-protein] synthase-3 [Pseudobutyrivibrio sp. YE44]|uniref:beta-ketoacyl-ACP synthase III n=1 Tax=Pseudobutyrivibrio sp. YE44 TaxID=1520802 RepID=UPI0008816BE7|nr:beta-ketoacyl-ACP synthase III [Pseudobutyrivibrio sp. YE44]SDB48651.1 3-oxoacyl-[acyl-carrier-protein] synthase-3 [Pseudobutyrivibrio sp. YE44]